MSLLTPGRNIVLAGLMGAGKTTVGTIVADRLAREFLDTDDLVEREAGRTISEIFAESGERVFRDLEAEAVRGVATLRGRVIAVGGGAILRPDNVTHLRATGDIVLLDAEPGVLAERVGEKGGRPLLDSHDTEERLRQLRVERDRAYRGAVAGVVDTTGKTPEEAADEILAWARSRPGLLSRDEQS